MNVDTFSISYRTKQEHELLEQPRQISPKPVQEKNKEKKPYKISCCVLFGTVASVGFSLFTDLLSDVPNIIKGFN